MPKDYNWYYKIVAVLLIVAALNWSFYGLLGLNLIETLLGWLGNIVLKVTYTAVGVAGISYLFKWLTERK